MFTKINTLLIVGFLFLVPPSGCKSTQRHDSSWAYEKAANTTYPEPPPRSSHTQPADDEWVCPMHPSFRQSEPGKCSICGMYLVRSGDLSSATGRACGSAHSHSSGSGHSGSTGCGHCGG
jgi:hypothetical protein